MSTHTEVPGDDDLLGLPVDLIKHDEAWVATVRAVAADGLAVSLTWDAIATSVTVVVLRGDQVIFRTEREAMASVRILESASGMHFEAKLDAGEIGGTLSVDIGSTVVIRDNLLIR